MKCGKSKMKSTNSHMKSKIVEMKNEAMKKFVYGVCECAKDGISKDKQMNFVEI